MPLPIVSAGKGVKMSLYPPSRLRCEQFPHSRGQACGVEALEAVKVLWLTGRAVVRHPEAQDLLRDPGSDEDLGHGSTKPGHGLPR